MGFRKDNAKDAKWVKLEAENKGVYPFGWDGDTLYIDNRKKKLTIIFKNGRVVEIVCDRYEIIRRSFGRFTVRSIEGITRNYPLYLKNSQIAAIIEE